MPDSLTNPILLGTLLVPQGFTAGRRPRHFEDGQEPEKEPLVTLGRMQLPRRDVERLRQILSLQRRLLDLEASPRAKRALMHRGPFQEALTWLEIHGQAPDVLEHWKGFSKGTVVPQEGRGRRTQRAGDAGDVADAARRRPPPDSELTAAAPADSCLAVLPLELAHELDQRVHALLGERVVDRRAHAADRSVALEAVEAGRGGLLHELASRAPRSPAGT